MVPIVGSCGFVARYFWKKENCFIQMKNKLEKLAEHDEGSMLEHDGIHEDLENLKSNHAELEKRLNEQSIYLKLLLKKFNIPYD